MSIRSFLGRALLASQCLSASIAVAQISNKECVNTGKAEKEVLALDQKRIDALLHNDVDFLELITDESYLHVHSSGRVRSKAQFMAGRENGSSIFSTFVIEENHAAIYCNVAVVAGLYHNSYKGASTAKRARHLRIYVHRNGKWKNILHQSTRISGSD